MEQIENSISKARLGVTLHNFSPVEECLLRVAVELGNVLEALPKEPQWHRRRSALRLIGQKLAQHFHGLVEILLC